MDLGSYRKYVFSETTGQPDRQRNQQTKNTTSQQQPHSRPVDGKDEGVRIFEHDGAFMFVYVLQRSGGGTRKAIPTLTWTLHLRLFCVCRWTQKAPY